MNREIKFRAYNIREKRWEWNPSVGCSQEITDDGHQIFMTMNNFEHIKVMQYTGLKDKNGKDIYEGDILRYKEYHNYKYKEEYKIDCVKWGTCYDSDGYCNNTFQGWILGDSVLYDITDYCEEPKCEVIGNIYENKELIKNDRQ